MPFHPEELYKHVKQLEQIYTTIPASDTNARTALAKAIISASANFLEGCLTALIGETLAVLAVPQSVREHVLGGFRGLKNKRLFVKERLAGLRSKWQVKENDISKFVEGRMKGNKPGLSQLRNKIGHGEVVQMQDLRLNNIGYFRDSACKYLEQVYASVGVGKPGWLGK